MEITKKQRKRIDDLTDGAIDIVNDFGQALDQWEGEHEIIKDLNADYDRYRIDNTQLIACLQLASFFAKAIHKESALFMNDKTIEKMNKFMESYTKLSERITELTPPPF